MKTILFLCFPWLLLSADPPKKCGTDEYLQQQLTEQPNQQKQWREQYRAANQANPSGNQTGRNPMLMNESGLDVLDQAFSEGVINIPVVVHVVAPAANHPANISMPQIRSQIDELNRAYSQTEYATSQNFPPNWVDDYAEDSQIRFCLAALDPADKPTRGVTRTFTTVPSFDYPSAAMKYDASGGKDAWPSTEYLNIWVVVITDGIPLGWATYPLPIYDPGEDGIVIDYRYFGTIGTGASPPYQLGRTCVHEVGHWLGLMHTWGMSGPDFADCEYDDLINDTPEQAVPNYGCGPFTTSCDGELDMLPNFMNYSDDDCNAFFTKGQVKMMRYTLSGDGFRMKLPFSEKGCSYP